MTTVTTLIIIHPATRIYVKMAPEVGLVVFLCMEIQTFIMGQLLFIYRAYLFTCKWRNVSEVQWPGSLQSLGLHGDSTRTPRGLHGDSTRLWRDYHDFWAGYVKSMRSPWGLVESMRSPWGVHEDLWSPWGVHEESMRTCGVHEESMGTCGGL